MKVIILAYLLFGSLMSFADTMHVEDGDKFTSIGKIERITLLQTLNIKPNKIFTLFGESGCYLEHYAVDFDRSLTAPRSFKNVKILSHTVSPSYAYIGFGFEGLKSAKTIFCVVTNPDITLGEMKEKLKGLINIQLSAPVEMD